MSNQAGKDAFGRQARTPADPAWFFLLPHFMPATALAFSGGLSSTVGLWELARQAQAVHCLYVDHGQPQAVREFEAAGQLVSRWQRRRPGQEVTLTRLNLSGLQLPENARIHFLLTAIATAFAEVVDAQQVSLAVTMSSLLDDIAPHLANTVSRITAPGRFSLAGKSLALPFVAMSKGEVVARGHKLNVPLRECWSCHQAGRLHCGTCQGCKNRKFTFANAALADPTLYQQDLVAA